MTRPASQEPGEGGGLPNDVMVTLRKEGKVAAMRLLNRHHGVTLQAAMRRVNDFVEARSAKIGTRP